MKPHLTQPRHSGSDYSAWSQRRTSTALSHHSVLVPDWPAAGVICCCCLPLSTAASA